MMMMIRQKDRKSLYIGKGVGWKLQICNEQKRPETNLAL
jgi:hypothetical protein